MTKLAHRIQADFDRANELSVSADAPNTARSYRADIKDWTRWAREAGVPLFPITPDALCAYIGNLDRRGLCLSTVQRRCAAIARAHKDKGKESPTEHRFVRRILKGLRREREDAPGRKKAMTPEILCKVLDSEMSIRDKAILAVGYVTGMRRSELVNLQWNDLDFTKEGVDIKIRHGKTGTRYVAVPYAVEGARCPARLLLEWCRYGHDKGKKIGKNAPIPTGRGMVFKTSDKTVSRLVKRAAKLCDLDPDDFGGHSLRAGLATTAAVRGVTIGESMAATGHKSHAVAVTYVRPVSTMRNRAFRAAVESLDDE